MAVLQLATATAQVRPWPAGGAWNNVTVVGRVAQKSTTWGITLKPGQAGQALAAANQLMNQAASTSDRLAQKLARGVGLELRDGVVLSAAQVGNGVTTNVLDREATLGPATVEIVTTVGATPTCTYQLEGSLNGSDWTPLSSADSGSPTVFTTTTFVITTATTTVRIVNPDVPWRFIRLTMSANVNVTNTINASAT